MLTTGIIGTNIHTSATQTGRNNVALHAAKLEKSDRLQRVDALLSSGKQYSTLEIIQQANVCAVNSVVAELKANGRTITCKRFGSAWYYWMEV